MAGRKWISILFVASLFAIGCSVGRRVGGGTTPAGEADGEDESDVTKPDFGARLSSLSFQLGRDSPLYDTAVAAAETWSKALGISVTVADDGEVPILLVGTVDPECVQNPGVIRGCSRVAPELSDSFIEIPESLHWSLYYGTLLHEMGHHLSGSNSHVDSVDAVMSANRKATSITLTPEDIAWVCAGPRIACVLN